MTISGSPTPDLAPTNMSTVVESVQRLAVSLASQRAERQQRRALHPTDFDRLREAGVLLACTPMAYGVLWESATRSTRALAELFRAVARADSSLALVASMHPAVLSATGWLVDSTGSVPNPDGWEAQRRWVFQTVRDGAWWSPIISEPGSGGDSSKTSTEARRGLRAGEFRISGLKHFGSGTGHSSYMVTAAVADGELERASFILDMRGVPLDGSAGVKLVAPWDGHGMCATQSHTLLFDDFPATRVVSRSTDSSGTRGQGSPLWPAIILGIVEVAMETAREELERRPSWRAYERVEWTHAEVETWLVEQAYEGMLRGVETGGSSQGKAKVAIAGLAESVLQRLGRVIGGSSYGRHSPFGHWLEDVRALGFLRPPWALSFDNLFTQSWSSSA